MLIKNKIDFNLTNDIVFKEVFQIPRVLSRLINIILDTNYSENDLLIINNEMNNFVNLKTSRLDIRLSIFNKEDRHYDINLEMQKNKPKYNLFERINFYHSKMISEASNKGDTYSLPTCINIVFINYDINKEYPCYLNKKCVTTVCMKDDYNIQVLPHKLIIIDLTKENKCDNINLKKWIKLIKSNEPEIFKGDDTYMDDAINKIVEVNADERKRALLMSKMKYELDLKNNLHCAKEEGKLQGIKEGKIETARNLLKLDVDDETIIKATGLTKDEISKLK